VLVATRPMCTTPVAAMPATSSRERAVSA
jgi:hypothetical protein